MISQKLKELEDPIITQVISEGLAATYMAQPNNPIEFFGLYLINQNKFINQLKQIANNKKGLETIKKSYYNKLVERQQNDQIQQQKIDKIQSDQYSIINRITECDCFQTLLNEGKFIQDIQRVHEIKNVYLLQDDFPLKAFELEKTEDPKAHLNMEDNEKILRVIAFDQDKQELKNMSFPKEENYLYDLIQEKEKGTEEENSDQQTHKFSNEFQNDFWSWRYISDIADPINKVYFYDIPQLGNQLSVCFEIKFYESKESLFDGLQKHKEFEQKQLELKDQSEKQNKEDSEQQNDNIVEKTTLCIEEIISQKRVFIIVFDNSDTTQKMSEQKQQELLKMVKILKEKWNEQNYQNLINSINLLNTIQGTINSNNQQEKYLILQQSMTEFTKQLQQSIYPKEKLTDQQEIIYSVLEVNGKNLKDKYKEFYMKEKQFQLLSQLINENIQILSQYISQSYFPFERVIQILLYLNGFEKNHINYENTNIFNFIKINQININDIIEKTINFNIQQTRQEDICQHYQKIDILHRFVAEVDQEEIKQNCFAIYQIYELIKSLLDAWIEFLKRKITEFQEYEKLRLLKRDQEETRLKNLDEKIQREKQKYIQQIQNNQEEEQQEIETIESQFDESEIVNQFNSSNPQIQQLEKLEYVKDKDFSDEFYTEHLEPSLNEN